MKRLYFWLLSAILIPGGVRYARAQTQDDSEPAWSQKIEQVDIVTKRPMKEIGVQQTKLDTAVLHDNIALSMADVLTQHTTIFIKQYGRATLSTASFRGTSPSHTQVTWNGMKINSPMLGMTDFSMIPSYFIDDALLLHGTSSVNMTGGGLGGAVVLSTKPAEARGFGLQYIQGVGSFKTFDEFLRLTYGDDHWQLSTRLVFSSAENKYKYRNYNKLVDLVFDDDYNLVSSRHPIEHNKCGSFYDLHVLQEAYYNSKRGNRFGLSAWYVHSTRGVPMLNVDYKDDTEFRNEQREQTFRGVLSWDRIRDRLKLGARAGYIRTNLGYNYSRDLGNKNWAEMIRARSYVNTLYGSFNAEYYIGKKWMFTADLSLHQHFVRSEDKNVIPMDHKGESGSSVPGEDMKKEVVGYDQGRVELSGYVSAKWRPIERLGISFALREDMYGSDWTPIIPAAFFDYVVSKRGNVVAKASISRNYRFPTLNDLYFLPGGNPDLKKEHGFTYDGGVEFSVVEKERYSVRGEVTAFDSYIDDWIIWLPTSKGFWTPRNIKAVHAYGVELKASLETNLSKEWHLGLDGNFAWTPSINHGDPVSEGDASIGKQLMYIPEYSAAITGRLRWKNWRFMYKWCYYGERFTTSSNSTTTVVGRLSPYFMSDISLEKSFGFRWAYMSAKCVVNNLLNEEYESVLHRPMPRMNVEFFIEIRPKWGCKK